MLRAARSSLPSSIPTPRTRARHTRRRGLETLALALTLTLSSTAAAQGSQAVIPERFATTITDTDFPGNDLGAIFDVDLGTCLAACSRDERCVALTFDAPNGACFPKGAVGEAVPFPGAVSAVIVRLPEATLARGDAIAASLTFVRDDDWNDVRAFAAGMAERYRADDRDQAAWLAAARTGDAVAATGAAVTVADSGTAWLAHARALARARDGDRSRRFAWNGQVLSAALAAAVRLDPALRAEALMVAAGALEIAYRGRDALAAAREAERLRPGSAGADLDRLIDAFGFRLLRYDVDAATAAPRLCLAFSEPLSATQDYAPYLQGDARGLAIEVEGANLCLAGVGYGNAYRITIRAGLPSAAGETIARSTPLELYVRDRAPAVRFPGRAYVLPATGPRALPIETVNAPRLTLELLRIAPGNLAGIIRQGEFLRAFSAWEGDYFASQSAEPFWQGEVDLQGELNRDTRSLLPLDDVGPLEPGMYLLRAAIPGADPYETAPATQWFLVSDVGITTLWGADGVHVIALSLATREALVDVPVTLVARSNRVLGRARTDERGVAHFPGGIARGTDAAAPALILVEAEGDLAVLSLGEAEFDLSDRGVSGRASPGPIDVFLTPERGVYRPGETVHATVLVRDAAARAIPGLPLTIALLRPDGVQAARIVSTEVGAGGHAVALPLGADVPRGAWRIQAFADPTAPALAETTILVEDFIPERIDVTLTLPDGLIARGENDVAVHARHDFGANASGFTVVGEAVVSAVNTLEGWPGFTFGPPAEEESAQRFALAPTSTDADGSATLRFALPDDLGARPYQVEVIATVSDAATRAVERRIVRGAQPTTALLGIDPAFDGVLPENAEAAFRLLLLSPEAQPIEGTVTYRLDRLRTRYQWYARYGSWYYEPIRDRERVAEGTATLTEAGAEIAAGVTWGSYELTVVLSDDPNVRATLAFYAGYGGDAGMDTPDRLAISLDREAYAPGDVARLTIAPDAAGTAMIAVLTDGLVDLTIRAVDGETVVELPVTEAWGTGAYVSATLIAPTDGFVPSRAIGIAHARVAPGERALDVAVTAPSDTRGDGPLTVTLQATLPGGGVPEGPVYATLAAVDAGALRLTGFTPPDPRSHYFAQRRLGVAIRDLYGRLIDARGGALGRVRSGGGDDAEARAGTGPLAAEDVVSLWSGPIELLNGRAEVTLDLPAFTGTVRLMAIAWSDTAVGAGDADVIVRDPIALRATLPRFMTPNDVSRLLLSFDHTSGSAGEVALEVTGHGVGKAPSSVTLAPGEGASVSVLLRPTELGRHDLRVAWTSPDGITATRTFTLPVIATTPEIASSSRIGLAAGESFTFDGAAFEPYLPGTARATMIGGAGAVLDPLAAVAALLAYPYGCTEQIGSGLLPLAIAPDLVSASGFLGDEDAATRMQRSVDRILARQDRIGGFGVWGVGGDDLWLNAATTEALQLAQAAGASVDGVAWRLATERLGNEVARAGDLEGDASGVAYALLVLARSGLASIGDLRYYADTLPARFTTPASAAMLAAALAEVGEGARSTAMFERALALGRAATDARRYRTDHGTLWRDRAALLALALEAGAPAWIGDAALTLLQETPTPRWRSTQEAAWALRAAVELGAQGRALLRDGESVVGSAIRFDDATPTTITNGGGSDVTLTLTTFGIPSAAPTASGVGVGIARAHFTPTGEAVDLTNVRVGDRIVVVIEVRPDAGSGGGRLMIDAALPAGFEIDNPNLLSSGDVSTFGWLGNLAWTEWTEARAERFLAAIDRFDDAAIRVAFVVRAVSPGTFALPAALVTDMYRPTLRATTATEQVTIRP